MGRHGYDTHTGQCIPRDLLPPEPWEREPSRYSRCAGGVSRAGGRHASGYVFQCNGTALPGGRLCYSCQKKRDPAEAERLHHEANPKQCVYVYARRGRSGMSTHHRCTAQAEPRSVTCAAHHDANIAASRRGR